MFCFSMMDFSEFDAFILIVNCVPSLPANICYSQRSVSRRWHPSLLAARLVLFRNVRMTADAQARRMACLLLPPLSLLVCYCCQSCHCGEPCSYCSCHKRPRCSLLLARRSQTHNSLGERVGFGMSLRCTYLSRRGAGGLRD